MLTNPFDPTIEFENDMADFKMPYQMYGKTDLEIMTMKYKKLSDRGHGPVVRLRK